MNPLLPSLTPLAIAQHDALPPVDAYPDLDGLILLVPEGGREALDALPSAAWLRIRLAAFPDKTNPVLLSPPDAARIVAGFVADDCRGFQALSLARKLVEQLLEERSARLGVLSLLQETAAATACAEAVLAAAHAALFELPRITREPPAADHLYAPRLLGRFVGKGIGWVHVDIAAGTHKGGLAHIPTDLQGFGVRFGTAWLRWLANDTADPS